MFSLKCTCKVVTRPWQIFPRRTQKRTITFMVNYSKNHYVFSCKIQDVFPSSILFHKIKLQNLFLLWLATTWFLKLCFNIDVSECVKYALFPKAKSQYAPPTAGWRPSTSIKSIQRLTLNSKSERSHICWLLRLALSKLVS